jgi:hypothetical protein
MSKGPGWIQRVILKYILEIVDSDSVINITKFVFKTEKPSIYQYQSVWRAVKTLCNDKRYEKYKIKSNRYMPESKNENGFRMTVRLVYEDYEE